MLDTGQFRFNLEVYQSKDENFERRIANRRLIRGLMTAAPLVVAALILTVVYLI